MESQIPIWGDIDNEGSPSLSPTIELIENAEETHELNADAGVILNVTLIGCVLLAYYIKSHKIYYISESAAAMLVGVVIGGATTFWVEDLTLYQFSPEVFFFVLLPPIIFEAGYSLKKKQFFDNFGTIVLYAIVGTIISTFVVGYLVFYTAKIGWVTGVSKDNPMEALLFGALISAVDPVATLSIMGSPELQCNQLLYSLVFGESVLNDAVAIVLFKTFRKFYDPDAPELTGSAISLALVTFLSVTIFSIFVGVGLGLMTAFIFKHTTIREFPHLETSLLFLFCYCCYATAEAINLSGIMALFFNGIVLSHYNSYNLSHDSRHAAESIFSTLATVTETIVFLYMGMGVFTSINKWNFKFTVLAYLFCLLGRALNTFPLSWVSNLSRKKTSCRITYKMQTVLWFAGLRGAIAFALAENLPGPNRKTYVTATLTICLITTVICGGFTDKILTKMGMKQVDVKGGKDMNGGVKDNSIRTSSPIRNNIECIHDNLRGFWGLVDDNYLKIIFGGSSRGDDISIDDRLGGYELRPIGLRDEHETETVQLSDVHVLAHREISI